MQKRHAIVLFFGFYLGYFVMTTYVIHMASNRYYDLTFAIVDEHRLHIDTFHENTVDKAFFEGHYYTAGLPGPALMGVPAYWLLRHLPALPVDPTSFTQVGETGLRQAMEGGGIARTGPLPYDPGWYFLAGLVLNITVLEPLAALAVVLVFVIAQQLGANHREAFIVAVAFGAGTPALFFATAYYSHMFATVAGLGALYCLIRWNETRRRKFFAATAFLLGIGLTMEYGVAMLALVMGLFILSRRPRIADVCLGIAAGLVGLLPLLLYNIAVYHTPLASPHQYVVFQEFQEFHHQGFLGMTWPHPEALWQLSFGPQRGIFGYAPILLLALHGFWRSWRQPVTRRYALLLMGLFVGSYLYNASYAAWDGGVTVGPRFMLIGLPAASLLLLESYRTVSRPLFWSLFILSIVLNLLAYQTSTVESYLEYWRYMYQSLMNRAQDTQNLFWMCRALLFECFAIGIPWVFIYKRRARGTLVTRSFGTRLT